MSDREGFQVIDSDVMGRIGELRVPRRDVSIETPVLFPVVNPHLQLIPPHELAEYAQGIITNAYILHESSEFQDRVVEEGVHELLEFDGVVMTDSGSFQLAEYGEITVTTKEILTFQNQIGSDIATPIDIPTPPSASRDQAENELNETLERLKYADSFDRGEMLVTGPIQGAIYEDLRKRAARMAYETSIDIFPIGGVVPLLRDYRFTDIVRIILASKQGLGEDAPVHLFGAGHPMMFGLAVSLGCDVFDSAAYALYARDDRYLTRNGTKQLDSLAYFPCACPVCRSTTPAGLLETSAEDRYCSLARHNLYVSFAEINRVKQAIRDGQLLELVEQQVRSHPALLDGYREALASVEFLERQDPVRKGSFFYVSSDSASRPEVIRYQDRLGRLNPPEVVVVSRDFEGIDEDLEDRAVWEVIAPFGPVPPGLKETHPVSGEFPGNMDQIAVEQAVRGINQFASVHHECTVVVIGSEWPTEVREKFADEIELQSASQLRDAVSEERE